MKRNAVSSWIAAVLVLFGTIGGLAFASGGALAASSCNIVVHGENGAHDALQSAIDSASPGQTICVHAGLYAEQITISTPGLRIVGAGAGRTIIDPLSGVANTVDWDSAATPHAAIDTLNPIVAVVLVNNVSGVILKGLTVNAAGAATSITGCLPGLVGVDFQNATSDVLQNAVVENAILSPSLLGCQFQIGVYAYTGYYDTGLVASSTVTMHAVTISAYGKGGIVCDDPGLTCDLSSVHVVGIGPTPATAMNGIQIAYGATGMISSSSVTGNDYTGASATNDFYGSGYSASGILLYLAGAGTTIETTKIVNNQMGILAYDDAQDNIVNNHIRNSVAYGIVEYGMPSTIVHITANTIANPSTKSIGVFVANGTFYLTGNTISYALDSGDQGASQAVTGPGTDYPSAPAESIATAGIQAVSDGGPTAVYLLGNVVTHSSSQTSELAVFGGTVTISP